MGKQQSKIGKQNKNILKAIDIGSISLVKKAIEAGADVNLKDGDGHLSLCQAVRENNIEFVRELINTGSDVNLRDGYGKPPLRYAIIDNNIEIVRELINAGSDVNMKDGNDYMPLRHAILNSNIDIIRVLINAGSKVNLKDRDGNLPLRLAIRMNNIEIVKELINGGSGVNLKDGNDYMPLHHAIWESNIEIVMELINAGSYVNLKDGNGNPPLRHAIRKNNIEIVRELINAGSDVNLKDGNGDPPLRNAIRMNNIDIVKELIKAGSNVNLKDGDGHLPLCHAICENSIEIVRELINAGSDVNLKDGLGDPPLRHAIIENKIEIVRELIRHKACVSLKDNHGFSLLELALNKRHGHIIGELINVGAAVDVPDPTVLTVLHILSLDVNTNVNMISVDENVVGTPGSYNRTLLHVATSLGYHKHIKYLLSCSGINVNAKDDFGQTPLHCSTQIGNDEIIHDLVNSGCDLEALDNSGKSVLHLAAIYGHCNLIDIFIKNGLHPNATDKYGRNSLHYAVMYRHDEVVKSLLKHGADSGIEDCESKTPRDYLYKCEENSLIFSLLKGTPLEIEVFSLREAQLSLPSCSNETHLRGASQQLGIGSVGNIKNMNMNNFVDNVRRKVQEVIHKAIPGSSDVEVIGCGSSFEGSKVGLPDELDFLVRLFSVEYIRSKEEGYGQMERDEEAVQRLNIMGTYGIWLWSKLMAYWSEHQSEGQDLPTDKGRRFQMPLPPQRHPDRKTCTTWVWLYSDDIFQDLPVSIDFVPAIEADLEYSTWMITRDEMEISKCYIVPKIPYENSMVSQRFIPEDLNQLGRLSYPTLEVEHLMKLDKREMDVFITAKCLRKPEICALKIRNVKGQLVLVSEYITSYRLKTVFLHLVVIFLKSDMSLGKMVLMVYEQLERCLERGRLPMFFDPEINVLAGSRLSREDSLKVARIMTRLVRSMYEREYPAEQESDSREETRVLQKERDAYDRKMVKCERNNNKLKGGHYIVPTELPLYLEH